jgi:hypothetical protein
MPLWQVDQGLGKKSFGKKKMLSHTFVVWVTCTPCEDNVGSYFIHSIKKDCIYTLQYTKEMKYHSPYFQFSGLIHFRPLCTTPLSCLDKFFPQSRNIWDEDFLWVFFNCCIKAFILIIALASPTKIVL